MGVGGGRRCPTLLTYFYLLYTTTVNQRWASKMLCATQAGRGRAPGNGPLRGRKKKNRQNGAPAETRVRAPTTIITTTTCSTTTSTILRCLGDTPAALLRPEKYGSVGRVEYTPLHFLGLVRGYRQCLQTLGKNKKRRRDNGWPGAQHQKGHGSLVDFVEGFFFARCLRCFTLLGPHSRESQSLMPALGAACIVTRSPLHFASCVIFDHPRG